MQKNYRIILYTLSIFVLLGITYVIEGNPLKVLSQFWLSSGLLLLILLSLIDQPFFSKDANVFVNAVTATISLLLIDVENHNWIFWTFLGFVLYLLISSYILFWIRKNPLNEEKKIVQFFSKLNRINMQKLIDMKILFGINDAPRGFKPITREQFFQIMEETKSEKSFVVN